MDKVRVDRWLWAARFYKTRQLAAEAVNAGHVHVNGVRVKPGRALQIGDEIRILKVPYTYSINIAELATRRGPAREARQLYVERTESIQAREALQEQLRMQNAMQPAQVKRPDKRERRKIIRFINKYQ